MRNVVEKALGPLRRMVSTLVGSRFERRVYVSRTGLTEGLLRRGGLGFLSTRPLSNEEVFLRELDLAEKTVFDIGAANGLTTLFFARKVGPAGRVIAFEPNPRSNAGIHDHIELNGFSNVSVFSTGIGEEASTVEFLYCPDRPALGTANPELQKKRRSLPGTKTVMVDIDSLDHLISENDLPSPDFIKLDVEGLELFALRGMARTLENHRPKLMVELHGQREEEVALFLLERGYRLLQVEEQLELTRDNLERDLHGHIFATKEDL